MKRMYALAVVVLVGMLTVVGCNQGMSTEKTALKQKAAVVDVAGGVHKMLSITKDLKAQLDAGDAAKVKVTAPQLEEAWASFEDGVKAKYPNDYQEVEKSLDPLVTGAKVNPSDKATLTQLNDQLTQALSNLAKKVH